MLIRFRIPKLQTCMFNANLHFVTQFEKHIPLISNFLKQKIVNVFDKKFVSNEIHAPGRHSLTCVHKFAILHSLCAEPYFFESSNTRHDQYVCPVLAIASFWAHTKQKYVPIWRANAGPPHPLAFPRPHPATHLAPHPFHHQFHFHFHFSSISAPSPYHLHFHSSSISDSTSTPFAFPFPFQLHFSISPPHHLHFHFHFSSISNSTSIPFAFPFFHFSFKMFSKSRCPFSNL